MTGEWRRLHNDELHELYDSSDVVRIIKSQQIRWARHVARMGEKRKIIFRCGWKAGRKEVIGKTETLLGDNIRRDLGEVGVRDENWLDVFQDRILWRTFVTVAMNL